MHEFINNSGLVRGKARRPGQSRQSRHSGGAGRGGSGPPAARGAPAPAHGGASGGGASALRSSTCTARAAHWSPSALEPLRGAAQRPGCTAPPSAPAALRLRAASVPQVLEPSDIEEILETLVSDARLTLTLALALALTLTLTLT